MISIAKLTALPQKHPVFVPDSHIAVAAIVVIFVVLQIGLVSKREQSWTSS
jgi:hypothetical protein